MSQFHDRAEDAAAAWDARLRRGRTSFRERQAFHAWLEEDPQHRAAHDQLQAGLSALRAHADLPELSALRDEARNQVRQGRRRRFARIASGAVAAVLALTIAVETQTPRGAEPPGELASAMIYTASAHERTKVTLGDGSLVTLDAGTRLAARLGATRRDVTLLAGHAMFEVAKDASRPFVVRAGDRTITALGTVFDVRMSASELRVTLAEGAVTVRAARAGADAAQQILKPSQQFIERAGGAAPILRAVDAEQALGWADGHVFFDNEPLARAVEEMNRYSPMKIAVDPAVSDLRINGMFRTNNQQGFLDALGTVLPVRVKRESDGRIRVSGRTLEDQPPSPQKG